MQSFVSVLKFSLEAGQRHSKVYQKNHLDQKERKTSDTTALGNILNLIIEPSHLMGNCPVAVINWLQPASGNSKLSRPLPWP